MLESKDHSEIIGASGALDLTFASGIAETDSERQIRATGLLRRLDGVAIGAARHQAILHLAGGREVAGEPDSDGKQHNDDHQPKERTEPVIAIAMIWIGHRTASFA
jgi:hypothetical protein